MKLSWVLFFLLFIALSAVGQNINPGVDKIFRPDEIAVIRLTLAPADKAFMQNQANSESEQYFPATFQMINSQFDSTLEDQVGVRLRGNNSREHNKKSFKIDFREYDGKKFYGYKKFNLKANANDPSFIRELLTLQCYREMNIPAARTHFIKLYMNDEYMGLYLNVEQIDDEFLNLRHGHENGFLYKCSFGASLQMHNGQINNNRIFESELNEEEDTRSELAHFAHVLNHTPTENFKTEIEKVFDVNLYLKQLAVEVLMGHWDGYSYNMNNYYLFYNGERELFEFFPYDADNTWGIDFVNKDWAKRSLNSWYRDEPRPLTTRILAVPSYRTKYYEYLSQVMELYFNEAIVFPMLDQYKDLLSAAVQNDSYYDDEYGFTYQNFVNSFTTSMTGNHVEYGIRDFLQVRTEYALKQIPDGVTDVGDDADEIKLTVYPNPSSNPKVFIYSTTLLKAPVVYHISGIQMPVQIREVDSQNSEIILQPDIPSGIYLIQVNGKTIKWIYK